MRAAQLLVGIISLSFGLSVYADDFDRAYQAEAKACGVERVNADKAEPYADQLHALRYKACITQAMDRDEERRRPSVEAEAKARKAAADAEAKARAARGPVSIGMTAEQVKKSSWGEPDYVRRTTTARGTNEIWRYGLLKKLYFDNGKLVMIDE